MHRIDADAHVSNQFSDGDPGIGQPGTKVDSAWLNACQEEIANVIEAAGITLVKGTNTQLLAACVAAATANRIVRRDSAGRAQFADPAVAADAATRGYVDAGDAATTGYVDGLIPRALLAAGVFNGSTGVGASWNVGISASKASTGVFNFTLDVARATAFDFSVLATVDGDFRCYMSARSASGFTVSVKNAAGTLADPDYVNVSVFGI